MNKFLRIISTLVVGSGLILLFAYLSFQSNLDKSQVLNQPSCYTLQNYWHLLIAGCGCVAFSIVSCFLAWNKKMDEKVEILPNAVAADKTELIGWLTGSSLDTRKKLPKQERSEVSGKTGKKALALKKIDDTVTQKPVSTNFTNVDFQKENDAVANGEETVLRLFDKDQTLDAVTAIEDTPTMKEIDSDRTVLSDNPETLVDEDNTVIEKS